MKLPHPVILLIAGVAICATLTWILPAGEYERRDDPATRRRVVVAGTYHRVEPAPVGPFAAVVAKGRPGTLMPAFESLLTADEIRALDAFVRSRDRLQ